MGLLGYGATKILRGSNTICMIDIVYILIHRTNTQVSYAITYNIHVPIENIGDLAIIELFGPAVFMRLIMFNTINILTRS